MSNKTRMQVTITANGGKAQIRIVDVIAADGAYSANSIRNQVDSFLISGITDADVDINSVGGSVLEATEIVNQLRRFSNVTVRVGAVAASAATYITSSFYTVASPSSRFMVHRPSLEAYGNIQEVESAVKLLKDTTQDYLLKYSAKTGMPVEEIESLWANGDYWMTAQEALEKKFIDKIQDVDSAEQQHSMGSCQSVAARLNWTLEDYLDKDPEAYDQMKTTNPALAAQLENDYFGKPVTNKMNIGRSKYSSRAAANIVHTPNVAARASWTLEDYLEKDPESYNQMKTTNPALAAQLENDYFNNKSPKVR